MKWLRIILPIFLIMGMLLCVSSFAYADGPPDPPDPPSGGDPPADPGLDVDIVVVGDNSDVGVDLYGADNTANVEFHSENPTVYINGQNLNEPTVIIQNYDSGAGYVYDEWARDRLNKDILPWIAEFGARMELTANGLAKVILLALGNESQLETQISLVGTHDNRLTTLESETANLGERADALEAQDAAIQARITAEVNYLIDSYNRILLIIIGAFSLVVIGLGAGLFLLWRRTRISA